MRRLKTETIRADISVKFSSHNLSHFEDSPEYAHSFGFEMCDGFTHINTTICSWKQNELTTVRKTTRDWRGRYHKTPGFTEHRCCPEGTPQPNDAPLLQCEKVTESNSNSVCDVCGAYTSLCLAE